MPESSSEDTPWRGAWVSGLPECAPFSDCCVAVSSFGWIVEAVFVSEDAGAVRSPFRGVSAATADASEADVRERLGFRVGVSVRSGADSSVANVSGTGFGPSSRFDRASCGPGCCGSTTVRRSSSPAPMHRATIAAAAAVRHRQAPSRRSRTSPIAGPAGAAVADSSRRSRSQPSVGGGVSASRSRSRTASVQFGSCFITQCVCKYSRTLRASSARARKSCDEELFSLIPSICAISRWEYSSMQ